MQVEAVQLSFQINLILPNLNSAIFCSVLGYYTYLSLSIKVVSLSSSGTYWTASPPPPPPLQDPFTVKLGETVAIALGLFAPAVFEIVLAPSFICPAVSSFVNDLIHHL